MASELLRKGAGGQGGGSDPTRAGDENGRHGVSVFMVHEDIRCGAPNVDRQTLTGLVSEFLGKMLQGWEGKGGPIRRTRAPVGGSWLLPRRRLRVPTRK